MIELLGGIIGFWLVYALLAAIFKHKVGLILAIIGGITAGISSLIIKDNGITLLSTIISTIIIFFAVPLQIRSDEKEEWKKARENKQSNIDDSETAIKKDKEDPYQKNYVICSKCGTQVFDDQYACPDCGMKIKNNKDIVMENEIENVKTLNRMGKSWFVLYKYYEVIDKTEMEWKNCGTVTMRKSYYEKSRENHLEWLHYIIFANENKLSTNNLKVDGFDITTMACIIYDKLTGKEK